MPNKNNWTLWIEDLNKSNSWHICLIQAIVKKKKTYSIILHGQLQAYNLVLYDLMKFSKQF